MTQRELIDTYFELDFLWNHAKSPVLAEVRELYSLDNGFEQSIQVGPRSAYSMRRLRGGLNPP